MSIRTLLPVLLLVSFALAEDEKTTFQQVLSDLASTDASVKEGAFETALRIGKGRERLVEEALARPLPMEVKNVLRCLLGMPSFASIACTEINWKGDGPGEAKGLHHTILVAEGAPFGPQVAGIPEGQRPFLLAEVLGPDRARVSAVEGVQLVGADGVVRAAGTAEIGSAPVRFRVRCEGGGADLVVHAGVAQEANLLRWSEAETGRAQIHLFASEREYGRFAIETARGWEPAPEVDFERFRVLAVSWGPQPTRGYRVDLRCADVCAGSTRIEVKTHGGGPCQAICYPMLAISIPRIGAVELVVSGARDDDDFHEGEFEGVRVTVEPAIDEWEEGE